MHRVAAVTLALVVAFACFATQTAPADAQLIVLTREFRVAQIDASHGMIKVSKLDSDSDAGAVLVGPETRLYVFNQELPNFSWRLLQRGMKITVRGGMTWDLKLKAKQIYI